MSTASAESAVTGTVPPVTLPPPVPPEPSAVPEPAAGELVSLRAFAAMVPMPETTARRWCEEGRIRATRTVTGRYRVPVEQLATVRHAFGLPPTPEVQHP